MRILIGLKRCTTCKDVEKLLQEHGKDYEYREIDKCPPTKEELKLWLEKTGLPISRFWNTSGMKYREENLAQKRKEWTEDKQLETIAEDGMLCKRPILLEDDAIYVGPDVKKYLKG